MADVSRPDPLRVAMLGTRGVPARYGGFETAVEEIGSRLAARGHRVVVHCRPAAQEESTGAATQPSTTYRGMRLVQLPALRRRSLETLSHTGLSVVQRHLSDADAVLVFNAANAPWLPVLRARGLPVATHVDGLEWRRAKWGGLGKRYYRAAEALAVRWSDALIADAQGIADYYQDEFGAATRLLTYGAPVLTTLRPERLAELGLRPHGFHLVVARFEPENHVLEAVQGYVASEARLPLVVVGSAPYADAYTARVHAAGDGRVRFLGGVWDADLLDQLYAHAVQYVHGHSVGGTNPSLLRAIGAGAPGAAYDVSFNREVLGTAGRYWRTPADLARLVEQVERDPEDREARSREALRQAAGYSWDSVTDGYERLCQDLRDGRAGGARPSGRRTGRGGVR